MSFTQQTFLGATIQAFDTSIRRGDGSSELNVTLQYDEVNGDRIPDFVDGTVEVGSPAYFTYDDFSYGGIIRSWDRVASSGDFLTYRVTLTDCREILAGIQVIISDYVGTVPIPNMYNVYGYLESFGYGNSGLNESGIPLFDVVNTLSILTAATPIRFKGGTASNGPFFFGLDLSELPIFSANYRIAGPNITILELIEQVCGDAGYDFYFELISGVIKLQVISRATQSATLTSISDYVTSIGTPMAYNAGRELRNETTSKFIIGGPRIDVFFQEYNNATDALANIWPFWGFDSTGKAILGTGSNNDHVFTVDSRHLDVFGVGATYTMDVAELRAAAAGKSSWETLLNIRNGIPGSVQYKRADNLGLVGALSDNLITLMQNDPPPTVAEMMSKSSKQMQADISANLVNSNRIHESINRLYEFVKKYANEYYGRQFMVTLPFTISEGLIEDVETGEFTLIQKPQSSGWIDESSTTLDDLITQGYLPDDFNRYTTEDGRIKVMVAISNYTNYDFSDFNAESFIVSGSSLFILADVAVNKAVTTGDGIPRAVITLPGTISPRTDDGSANLSGILKELFEISETTNPAITEKYKKQMLASNNLFTQSWEYGASSVIPELVVLPLEHSQKSYGPWYAAGAAGRVDFESASDLVPWNFGSESAMNQIGNARVANAITNVMEEESGSVTLPFTPERKLGDRLNTNGPYITDIEVRITAQGPQTTYTMKTWSPRLIHGVAKSQLEAIQRIAKSQQLARRRLRDYIKINNTPPQYYQDRKEMIQKARKNNTSNAAKTAKKAGASTSNKKSKQDISSVSFTDADFVFDDDYQANVVMSIDGMEAAYSTSAFYGDGQDNPPAFPFFETIDETEKPTTSVPHRTELDPFNGEHDIQMLTTGTEIPKTGLTDTTSDEYRAIGLRGPLMMVGYGRDANGFPVPNKYDDEDSPVAGDVDSYLENHKQRRDTWKAGPFDMSWDADRGVWYSSPVILEGYLIETLDVYGSGNPPSGTQATMDIYRVDPRNNMYQWSGEQVQVTNRDPTLTADSGTYVQVRKIGNEYRPFWVGCA